MTTPLSLHLVSHCKSTGPQDHSVVFHPANYVRKSLPLFLFSHVQHLHKEANTGRVFFLPGDFNWPLSLHM